MLGISVLSDGRNTVILSDGGIFVFQKFKEVKLWRGKALPKKKKKCSTAYNANSIGKLAWLPVRKTIKAHMFRVK